MQRESTQAVQMFYEQRGRLPSSLDELVPPLLEELRRGTEGAPYRYAIEGDELTLGSTLVPETRHRFQEGTP
jgi:hypothetical protein